MLYGNDGGDVMIKVDIKHFSDWYFENRVVLLERAEAWKKQTIQLEKEFLKEWPLERIKEMELDEYVIGRGADNKSLCYEIEAGKYSDMHLGIRGGLPINSVSIGTRKNKSITISVTNRSQPLNLKLNLQN